MNIIGQKNLIKEITSQLNSFPRFCIIFGEKGSGKKYISEYISECLGLQYIICSTKIDDVRNIINNSYTHKVKALYVFPDCDNMSVNAKNALLKITEEPPQNSYFIMTAENKNNILETLISRACVFNMNNYSAEDIEKFIEKFECNIEGNMDLYMELCKTPNDVKLLSSYNIEEFYNYCERVLDNIGKVEGSNAFKIVNKLGIKDEGWDIKLFLNTVCMICLKRLKEKFDKSYVDIIKLCSETKNEIQKGYNKSMTMDSWILSMRGILLGIN